MVTFPNAKINIGLNILSKRPDGYHNINSCFYPIPFTDILEIVKADKFEFTSSGITIPGEGNLCTEAFELLRKDYNIGNVKIHLHKNIPIGGGLGGGSADATFTLKMLNKMFELGLSESMLKDYAAQLGSDCPFFVENKPALAEETGTKLKVFDLNLEGFFLVLIAPGIHVSTAEAYSGVTPGIARTHLHGELKTPIENWKHTISNDFETSVFPKYPKIGQVKKRLYSIGALYASMTGSGSAVYGLFSEKPDINSLGEAVCWSGWLD